MRLLALVATGVLALSACGSSKPSAAPSPSPSAPSTSGSPSASPSGPAFNPCDSIDVAAVSHALGAKLTLNKGTTDTPRCALLPVTKGGPTFEMSYLRFDGGLDEAWKTMKIPTGKVTEPAIEGADAVKLIVQRKSNGYVLSAFLQNGSLIQSLNGVALPPYHANRMHRATTAILTQLSAHAPRSLRVP